MDYPDDLGYTKKHEWVRIDGETATVGITDYAQDSLGDIVYLELPKEGVEAAAGDAIAVIESVKSVSDIYMPLAGMVTKGNTDLEETPETINEDPYGKGWLFMVTLKDEADADDLMSADDYESYVGKA